MLNALVRDTQNEVILQSIGRAVSLPGRDRWNENDWDFACLPVIDREDVSSFLSSTYRKSLSVIVEFRPQLLQKSYQYRMSCIVCHG